MTNPSDNQSCESPNCGCHNGLSRRDFVELLGLGTAAALASGMPAMAGPFEAADFEKQIPADKKLSPEWVKSLTARGTRTVYRGKELDLIGMPIGGLCSGQLYLGGDGRLWRWDIFNQHRGTGDGHYAHPPAPDYVVEQGFELQITVGGKTTTRKLDRSGFADITFTGEYPIGHVEYRDPQCPLAVSLEAFSPFIPLNVDDSSLPTTVLRFTVKNTGSEKVEGLLFGFLENAVCMYSAKTAGGRRQNRVIRQPNILWLDCSMATATPQAGEPSARPDIMFEDFNKETYEGWEVTGTAFGKGPILKSQIPEYQGDVGSKGPRVVNSHASAPGDDVAAKDNATGTLTSKPFKIERAFINFWIGGGNNPVKTCINVLVDGKVVASATGHNSNQMRRESLDVRKLAGKTARLQILDEQAAAWGNIGIAEIVFSDKPVGPTGKLEDQADFGTMGLGLLEPAEDDFAAPEAHNKMVGPGNIPVVEKHSGALGRKFSLAAGQSATVTFVLAWHFPNLKLKDGGRYYATRFQSAGEVAEYVAKNLDALAKQTRLWHDTWYDSTLPYWFLDRTLLNTSILATSTAFRFRNGRFWGWEGVGCCDGTCTHVWHYAHAVARLFPELERDLRKRTDFGTALNPQSGVINHRGEHAGLAVDGQAGCILRAYREHLMSADGAFLKQLWPKIKIAMQCLVRMDDGKGIVEGAQHNTLDQAWFGRVAWLSSLYLAAARACEEMAREMGDEAYAAEMRKIVERGGESIDRELFNGEYYYQIPDAAHVKTVGSHNGCEIDQVFGQSWAWQVGLGRIMNEENVKKALASLWRYNFTPDVGPFRAAHKPGRWYAMPGEAGLLMCSWPKGEQARVQQGFDFYFNECMNGFEYQAAGHMIWEGMVQEGLAITRAIHDRYHASRRNPWNEVECGDHYARSMASYGVYLAACGYEYHGPKGYLAFAPRLTPDDFRAAFTTAEGWGTFTQKAEGGKMKDELVVKWGKLRLKTLALALPEGVKAATVSVTVAGKPVESKHTVEKGRVTVTLAAEAAIEAGQTLEIATA